MGTHYTELVKGAIIGHWSSVSVRDYPGQALKYYDVGMRIARLHTLFRTLGLRPGDNVAVCGKNCANWIVSFLAVTTYGTVAVPIMREFRAIRMSQILEHSGCKMLFCTEEINRELSSVEFPMLESVVLLENFSIVYLRDKDPEAVTAKWTEAWEETKDQIKRDNFGQDFYTHQPDELLMVSYTSGTTSNPKGVMLSEWAVVSNLMYGVDMMPMHKGDTIVSALSIAHLYMLVCSFLIEFVNGVEIYMLPHLLSHSYVQSAFLQARPRMLVLTPQYIESLVRRTVLPRMSQLKYRIMRAVPILRHYINRRLCNELRNIFGGNIYQVVLGGASLGKDVESALHSIGFPYTVGYGMTECGPLVCYSEWQSYKRGSCGKPVDRMRVRIDSNDPYNNPGEILVTGDNLMLGYYKNNAETHRVIDKSGWLHTGDIGVLDRQGYVYIKGRLKSMIVLPSGLKIFPEDIEAVINANPFIADSLVVQRDGSLVALVEPNMEDNYVKTHASSLDSLIQAQLDNINQQLPLYEQLESFEVMKDGFQKTPKRDIKRYLYQ